MLKKLFPYIVVTSISIVIFICGFYFGVYVFGSIKSTTILQDQFLKSAPLEIALYHLDKGEGELARQFLVLQLDTEIISINNFAKYSDKQSYNTACNILYRIAKHRKDNPAKYSAYTYPSGNQQSPDIRKEVAGILHKWESCKNN